MERYHRFSTICFKRFKKYIFLYRFSGQEANINTDTSRAGQAGGGSFKEKNYKPKKEFAYRMCTGWPTTAMPKPSFLSERVFSRSMVVMWWPVSMWLVAGWDPKFCGWLWDDARWGHVVSCEMSCHVMWCNLMCLHFMWCDFLCSVMSRDALRCHVMSSHVMSCHLLWSDAVQWDEILWVCDAVWLVAMSRCVVRRGCLGWIGRWSGDPYYTDLLRTTQYYKVLLQYYNCTTHYYSSTTLYYKVLLQYYSVLQSTTPVLLRTTKYYSSTTLYYKVLLQYYSVLQSTTLYYNVLLQYYSVVKYCSNTILYYKVLLQYYSALQSTTPVLLTLYYKVLLQYYSVLQSATLYYTVLQRTTPVLLCGKVLLRHYSVLQSTTSVLLCTTKYTLQARQKLPLPRKMMRIIDCRNIWNVIYNARSNKHHPPTSPNTAPAM